MHIKKISENELNEVSDLIWKTFYKFNLKENTVDGIENFRDSVSPVSLYMNTFDNSVILFGSYEENILTGVIGIKENGHIVLLFVRDNYQRRGVGKKLINYVLNLFPNITLTVNSSLYALPFYKKIGFIETDGKCCKDGITFIPMERHS